MCHVIDLHTGNSERNILWTWGKRKVPKQEIEYFCQVILVYIIAISSILNLAFTESHTQLWTGALCLSIAYLLPNPRLVKTTATTTAATADVSQL